MDIKTKKELIEYLRPYVTEHKQKLIERVLRERTRFLTIALENVYQPHNASAVLRSAECFGVQEVNLIESSNKFTATEGIAMGAAKWLMLKRYQDTQSCYQVLKQHGYKIIATTPHTDGCELPDLPIDHKMALIFGTEDTGLSKEALDVADAYVKIPMFGFTESFNISVSVALCLYDIMMRLHASCIDWRLSADELVDLRLQYYKNSIRAGQQLVKKFLNS